MTVNSKSNEPVPATHQRGRAAPRNRWQRALGASAAAWRTSPRWILALWALPLLIALGGVVAALAGKDVFKWYTGEDGFVETLQALAYAAAAVLTAVLARRLRRAGAPSGIVALYGGLFLGLCFMVGEEISWGQRLLGFATPAAMVESNKQAEANLHNIYGVGATFKWVQMLAAAYGAILPLLLLGWAPLAARRERLAPIVPHASLVPYFAPLFLWRLYRNLAEPPAWAYFAVSEFNEVWELLFALGILLFLVCQWRRSAR